MPNTFVTQDLLADAAENAAILLRNNLVAANLINRNVETTLVNRQSGGKVRVKVRPQLTANIDEQNRGSVTLQKTDNTQSTVEVDATNYIYIKEDLETPESSWDLEAFTFDVVAPMALGVAEQVDQFLVRRIAGGFSPSVSVSSGGSVGDSPADIADMGRARRVLNEQKAPMSERVALISALTDENLLNDDKFINADYGEDAPQALREGSLGRRLGIDFFMDQNVGTHPFGDTGGTVVTNGSVTQGDEEVDIDGLGTSDGVIRQGARFTIAGDSQVYTVTKDVFYSGTSATLPITPAAATGSTDGSGITFETAHTQDVVYYRPGMLGAIVAPQPLQGSMSETGTFENITVRLTIDSSLSGSDGATDEILMDVYVGGQALRPEFGTIVQG
jgi:hypothetical protein